MALWNDFSKKVANTKDKTVQQAKVLTETQKLNSIIAEEKKKIEACYRELGMQYAQLHHDDYEVAFAGVMGTIHAAEELIRESQAKIRDIKGIRCCEKCGAELSRDAAFCSGCGAVIPKPVVPAGRFCTGCGAALAEGVRFCTSCGTPVAKEEPIVVPTAVEIPAVDYGITQPVMEFPQPAEEPYFAQPAAEPYFTQPAAEPYFPQPAAEPYFPQPAVEEYPEQTVTEEEPRCPQCGAVTAAGTSFCTNCGFKLV